MSSQKIAPLQARVLKPESHLIDKEPYFGPTTAEAWIIRAMDVYDREGLYRGSQLLKNIEDLAELTGNSASAVAIEDVAQVLDFFVCGLSERRMKLDTATPAYTDTETIFLPPRIGFSSNEHDNFLFYKIILSMLWAQGRYGTFDTNLDAICTTYENPHTALALLNYLETVRLEARVARILPGLARDMARVRGPAAPEAIGAQLQHAAATVHDSIALLPEFYSRFRPPDCAFATALHPRQVAAAHRARIAREKAELQSALGRLLEDTDRDTHDATGSRAGRFSVWMDDASDADAGLHYELRLDGRTVVPPEPVKRLIDSMLQDLGEIPDDYLSAAGDGDYRGSARDGHAAAEVSSGVHLEQGAFFYNEWDHKRRHYRKNWCVLREVALHPGSSGFGDATLAKYRPQIAQLKRTFELMRGEEKLLKRQAHGDAIDLDAVVAAHADLKGGMELSDRLLVKRQKCRIAGIIPQDYTRMGAVIRHLTRLLGDIDARTKLLVAMSDGKPDDYSDHYRGEYGIEDTRRALIEAHRSGIKPFCITIDREARDYLPRMYGPVNGTRIDDVARLPLKVADIYRRLTM